MLNNALIDKRFVRELVRHQSNSPTRQIDLAEHTFRLYFDENGKVYDADGVFDDNEPQQGDVFIKTPYIPPLCYYVGNIKVSGITTPAVVQIRDWELTRKQNLQNVQPFVYQKKSIDGSDEFSIDNIAFTNIAVLPINQSRLQTLYDCSYILSDLPSGSFQSFIIDGSEIPFSGASDILSTIEAIFGGVASSHVDGSFGFTVSGATNSPISVQATFLHNEVTRCWHVDNEAMFNLSESEEYRRFMGLNVDGVFTPYQDAYNSTAILQFISNILTFDNFPPPATSFNLASSDLVNTVYLEFEPTNNSCPSHAISIVTQAYETIYSISLTHIFANPVNPSQLEFLKLNEGQANEQIIGLDSGQDFTLGSTWDAILTQAYQVMGYTADFVMSCSVTLNQSGKITEINISYTSSQAGFSVPHIIQLKSGFFGGFVGTQDARSIPVKRSDITTFFEPNEETEQSITTVDLSGSCVERPTNNDFSRAGITVSFIGYKATIS